MASPTLAPSRHHRLRILLRVLAAVVVLGVAAAVGVGAWFYAAARWALPQVDGTVKAVGLAAPVSVTRDAQGVPHITAATLEDLFFAQGYVTAQDRLWQMDITRRYAAGEIAEVLGQTLLQHDREQRILGLREAARRAFAVASQRDRRFLEAYARGVNASMQAQRAHLPLEFRFLRYQPRPWQPEDSLVMAAYMCQMLTHELFATELAREKILAKLGPELTADLYPTSSWRDRPPSAVPANLEDEPPPPEESPRRRNSADVNLPASVAEVLPDAQLAPGSNNWAVSGARTVSGKPLLSNDMHLGHQMPNLWYEVHLHAGEFNVAGVSMPGAPFVISGHNQRIAWGFTNLEPDVEDIYVENFNDKGEYQAPDGWRQPERRREVIKVKGGADVTLDVVVTRHGPVVTELAPGETRQLALKWTLHDPATLAIPFFDMNSAQNWEEFRGAVSRFGNPGQNMVYADIDGHIGYQATGFVPVRAAGDGTVPVSGADDAHEWTGYIPFDKMPSAFNPPSGVLATANGRITPDGYPSLIASQWGSPYRTARIYHVLERGSRKFAPADMLDLQTDIYSEFDRFCAERFVYAVDHAQNASARARQAADMMRAWDARMTKESAAATIVSAARQQAYRLLLEPKLGPGYQYRWFMSSVWFENTLLRQPPRWLPPKFGRFDDLLAAAVEATVSEKSGAPKDLDSWRWGRRSPVVIQHPVFGRIPLLQRWAAPGRHEQSGDGYTVKQVGRGFGPSERMTVDFSDLDKSTLNLVTGESGNLLSPHYVDQWAAWYEGRTFVLPFSEEAVKKAKAHELRLEP